MSAVFFCELSRAGRRGTGLFLGLAFFTMSAALFPFALGPYPELLQRAGVGALWICALFASLLTQEGVWSPDFDDGTYDVLALSPRPLTGAVLAKMLAHWLTAGIVLAGFAPVLALFFALPVSVLAPLCLSLVAGGFILSFAGGLAAIVALGSRRSGVLLPLLLLPLYIPVLIFGTAAVSTPGALYVLLAACAVLLPLCPLAGAACLRRALG